MLQKRPYLKELFLVIATLLSPFFITNAGADFATDLQPGQYLQDGSGNIQVTQYSVPLAFDWNNDGKKDLLVGQNSGGNGYVSYYENIGTNDRPLFGSPVNIQACNLTCSNLNVTGQG